jgi:hypothetical protein
MREVNLSDLKSDFITPQATSVCTDKNGFILVGTRGGEIIEFN